MNRPNPKVQESLVEQWNAQHPIGTSVLRYRLVHPRREPEAQPTKTRSEAWLLGGHTAVVMVEGVAGGVMVESLEVKS